MPVCGTWVSLCFQFGISLLRSKGSGWCFSIPLLGHDSLLPRRQSAAPTSPHSASLQASQKGLYLRGLQLNHAKCEYILPLGVHPPETPSEWKVRHTCFPLLGAAFGPPDFCLRKPQEKLRREPDQRPCPHDAPRRTSSSAPRKRADLLANCLNGIIPFAITQEAWLCALASIKKSGFGITDPAPRSSSTTSLSNSLWAKYNDTHDPDVAAA